MSAVLGRAAARARAAAARKLGRDETELDVLFVNGWRPDAANATALVFVPGSDRPALVAKLAAGDAMATLAAELRNLETLAAAPGVSFRRSVPAPLGFSEEDGAVFLLESALGGQPLHPAGNPRALRRDLEQVADWVVLFHHETGCVKGPLDDASAERLLHRPFAAYLERFRPGAAERRWLETAARESATLAREALPLVFAHGDLCAPNVLIDGGEIRVIDWEIPFSPGLPAFDLIHLLACTAQRDGDHDGLEVYQRAFFAEDGLARLSRTVLERYARALGLAVETLRPLFTLYWLDYAIEKADLERATGPVPPDRRATLEIGAYGLARFGEGTCLNLKLLADNERSFVLR